MDEQELIEHHRSLLNTGREAMAHLRWQYTLKGTDAPYHLLADMRIRTDTIRASKLALRERGIPITDDPLDELPTFHGATLEIIEERTPLATQASTFLKLQPVVNGDFGYRVSIGGIHEGAELLVLACPEHQHRDHWVRSGWLYSTHNAGAYLAVAFFKIVRGSNGAGYIHIRDVASPPHIIWLKAPIPDYQEANISFFTGASNDRQCHSTCL